MQKLIKGIFLGHSFYIAILLVLSSYILYHEFQDKEHQLKQVLAQDLKASRETLFAMHHQLKKEIFKVSKDYPNPQAEDYCHRLEHLNQQSNTISEWINSGISGGHNPYFPALKEAYYNQLELAKIYCDGYINEQTAFSGFNPEIAPFQKFCGPLFLEHAHLATWINMLASDQYFAQKFSYCGGISWDPFYLTPFFDHLNFKDEHWFQADIILGLYKPFLNNSSIAHHLFLNNQEFPVKDGVAKFRCQFDTPGIHPLQVRWQYNHPETDSVTAFEKTYYVKVD